MGGANRHIDMAGPGAAPRATVDTRPQVPFPEDAAWRDDTLRGSRWLLHCHLTPDL